MAYFNHAFCKSFLVTSFSDKVTSPLVPTQDLAAGQLGLYQGTWGDALDMAVALTTPEKNLIYLAQGSWMKADKVGTHGGYKESVKSKGINPKFLTRLWSSDCQDATASTVTIAVDETCAPCGENFFLRLDVKGSPALRFLNHNAYAIGDSSGDAAANGGDLPGLCCIDGQEFLDPAVALAAATQMLLADPIITPFVQEQQWSGAVAGMTVTTTAGVNGLRATSSVGASVSTNYTVGDIVTVDGGASPAILRIDTVGGGGAVTAFTILAAGAGYTASPPDATTTNVSVANAAATGFEVTVVLNATGTYSIAEILDGTYTPSTDPVADGVTASVTLVGAYVDTKFGDCTFDSRDFYEKEPVQLVASILDETGDPCNECGVVTSTPGVMQQTTGETVLRDLLLTERYMQNPYHQGSFDGFRMNEIEGFDTLKAAVDRDALYRTYYIQHSIPRLNNPTGVFDNDQYVYKVYVQCDAGEELDPTTLMDNIMNALATLCTDVYGNPITYETSIDAL